MTLAQQFFNLFQGLHRAHGEFKLNELQDAGKQEGKASTLHHPATVELWEQHLNGSLGLGIIPIMDDSKCWWGAIDVDVYNNKLDFKELVQNIIKLSLPLCIAKSKSGGAHLYLFMEKPVDAAIIRSKLNEWAMLLGYPKNIEIFPKQIKLANPTDVGNWINMPYYDLAITTRFGISLESKNLSAEEFIANAEKSKILPKDLKAWKFEDPKAMLSDGPPCLQLLCRDGVPAGARNNALFSFGVYCQKKYGDDWKDELSKLNHAVMDKPLGASEEAAIQRSLEGKEYFYKCKDSPLVEICNKSICLTRKFGIGNTNNPGVTIEHLTKMESDPPTWFVTIAGVKIQLDDTEDLIQQLRFRVFCMEKLNILPHMVKPIIWDDIVRGLLQTLEVLEAPQYLTDRGNIIAWLQDFCATRKSEITIDDVLKDKVFHNQATGVYLFKPDQFYKYVVQKSPTKPMNKNKLFSIIAGELQGVSTSRKIKGKSEHLYQIPDSILPMQTEDFDAKVHGEEF